MHLGALVDDFFHDDTTLLGGDLHHLDGHHIAVETDVVVELLVLDRGDAQSAVVHLQRRSEVAQGQPHEHGDQHNASTNPRPVLAWNAVFLLFQFYIHCYIFLFELRVRS